MADCRSAPYEFQNGGQENFQLKVLLSAVNILHLSYAPAARRLPVRIVRLGVVLAGGALRARPCLLLYSQWTHFEPEELWLPMACESGRVYSEYLPRQLLPSESVFRIFSFISLQTADCLSLLMKANACGASGGGIAEGAPAR